MNRGRSFERNCPGCEISYDLRGSIPAFLAGISKGKRILLVFGLCPSCADRYFEMNCDEALVEQGRIIRNIFPRLVDGGWSVTDSLTLSLYAGCYISAMTHGNYLPKIVFDAYNNGLIDISVLSGGCCASS